MKESLPGSRLTVTKHIVDDLTWFPSWNRNQQIPVVYQLFTLHLKKRVCSGPGSELDRFPVVVLLQFSVED